MARILKTKLWALSVVCLILTTGAAFADKAAFVKACESSTNLGPGICECCSDKAQLELTPEGFEFLTAMLEGDEAKKDQLKVKLSMPEIMKAGMFMVNTPGRCAQEASAISPTAV